MQKFAGLVIVGIANGTIYQISQDWRIICLTIVVGLGGLIYGDAD